MESQGSMRRAGSVRTLWEMKGSPNEWVGVNCRTEETLTLPIT